MTFVRFSLLGAIWALCAAGCVAAGAILFPEAAHPLTTRDPWVVWFNCVPPYFLLAGAGWLSYTRVMWQKSLLIITVLVMFIISTACYLDTQMYLSLLNAQAAGQHSMYCGPPFLVMAMPLAYGMSIIALSLVLRLPFQAI